MKKILFAALIALACVPFANAEIILLKDGKSVRGKIVYEDKESVIIEKKDYRCITVNRANIEEIKPDAVAATDPAPVLSPDGTPTREAKKKKETFSMLGEKITIEEKETIVRIGSSSEGSASISGKVTVAYGEAHSSANEDFKNGISIGAERFYYTRSYCAVGLGAQYDFPRKMERFSDAGLNFFDLYTAIKLRYYPSKGQACVYGVGRFGYGFLFADSGFKDYFEAYGPGSFLITPSPDPKTSGGLYYGYGLGIQYDPFFLEIFFSTNNGRVRIENAWSSYYGNMDFDFPFSYDQTCLSIGYVF